MGEEWGPWVEHDGKRCPIPMGTVAEAVRRNGRTVQGIVSTGDHGGRSAWVWGAPYTCPTGDVMEYRIRRPKGMAILKQLLADLPAPVASEVVG